MFRLISRYRLRRIKQKIRDNPFIGKIDSDGTYKYTEGEHTLFYCVHNRKVEWLGRKRQLVSYERVFKGLGLALRSFRGYKWQGLFQVKTGGVLIFVFLLVYLLLEPPGSKARRLEWFVSKLLGLGQQNVKYVGNGYIKIQGVRKTAVDRQLESFEYYVNPLNWLTFRDTGYVLRHRAAPYGDTIHPIDATDSGKVYI